ncbi:glycoside hydrolase family 27 protein [Flavobacterium undicola]|uniref:glycoside hydrolase family 27 protein n=1 Tax=Flavobacterium undicola TaxID=1932779 RepID=UPI0015E1C0C4|nr:glycoside hydrolase family 27 protein [Flavobacterium undicola]MBA0884849.1 glycoside hydrolase family 27 protein [Flavobacterium undicola]
MNLYSQKRENIGISPVPPMGWSSWNTFKKNPTEEVIKETVDAMVNTGLKDVGFTYINIDDFWSSGRDENGQIIIDKTKFPNGMKAVADYIHSKGLKAGIYTNIGNQANYATLASGGYYEQDIKTFAEWGYDYVKVDVNFASDRSEAAYKKEFTEVYETIKKTGRPMFLNICNQGGGKYENWAPSIGNSWRVGADIDHMPKGSKTQWEGVLYELDRSAAFPEIAGPGHWNDADMMLIGVGDDGGRLLVMSPEEQKSHFSLWCIISSPLILGNDLRNISKETLKILMNKEAIAINQDALGIQGRLMYEQSPGVQVWVKKLKSGNKQKYAVVLFNRTDTETDIVLDFSKVAFNKKVKIRDIWEHKDLGEFKWSYSKKIPRHGVQMLVVQ